MGWTVQLVPRVRNADLLTDPTPCSRACRWSACGGT